jgi:hypothetical protein
LSDREGIVEKNTIQQENEKKAYEKPVLLKHGNLKDLTATSMGSVGKGPVLGCTRF